MYVWDVRPAADSIDPQTDIIITFASYIMLCPSWFTVYMMSIVGSCQCHKDPYQRTCIRQYSWHIPTSHYLHFYVHGHSCYPSTGDGYEMVYACHVVAWSKQSATTRLFLLSRILLSSAQPEQWGSTPSATLLLSSTRRWRRRALNVVSDKGWRVGVVHMYLYLCAHIYSSNLLQYTVFVLEKSLSSPGHPCT